MNNSHNFLCLFVPKNSLRRREEEGKANSTKLRKPQTEIPKLSLPRDTKSIFLATFLQALRHFHATKADLNFFVGRTVERFSHP